MKLIKFVPDNTNIKFLKWGVPFYVVSAILVIASWALVFTKGLNYGVDFSGGQEISATFTKQKSAPIAELRELVGTLGYGDPVIQRFGAENEVSIRTKLPESAEGNPAAAEQISNQIIGAVRQAYPDVRIDGIDTVSGKVSSEFRDKALYAMLAAMVAIAIYIWVRFEWQFGVGGLLSLLHDVSLTMGMFALFEMEFNLQTIAAILALIGYSLNDTIVVYDRIRENLKKYRKMPIQEVLDLSVNETLSRTVMTTVTLLIALVPLLLFGPESLFGMTAAITLGIFVGTYSSVYMAGPILIWLGVSTSSFVTTESATDKQERLARERGA